MPRCISVGCTSGYDSNPEKVHFFYVPKNENAVELWKTALRRKDFVVKPGQTVCEKHFLKEDIIRQRELLGPDGSVLGVSPYKVPRLRKGALPCIFPWVETVPTSVYQSQTSQTQQNASNEGPINNRDNEENLGVQFDTHNDSLDNIPLLEKIKGSLELPAGWRSQDFKCKEINLFHIYFPKCNVVNKFFRILNLKEVFVKFDGSIQINIVGRTVDPTRFDLRTVVSNEDELQDLLEKIHRLTICQGFSIAPDKQSLNVENVSNEEDGSLRSVQCELLVSNVKVCQMCCACRRNIMRKMQCQKKCTSAQRLRWTLSPRKRNKILRLQNKYKSAVRAKKKTASLVSKLRSDLKEYQKKLSEFSEDNLIQHLEAGSISNNEFHAVKEIMLAAKRSNSKGRRYSNEWILLCILLRMRSASSYEFMHTNELLPLPSERTLRRYISSIKPTCGFDPKFFDLLKLALAEKKEEERHGILLIDEISTRESISVDTQTLTYRGLIDLGDGRTKSQTLNEKANHCLVVMFQPLYDTYTQPIAVFASRGPVKGDVIAQLIVKAIVLMENVGAKIHGIISDGASTNRKFWAEMGISAERNNLRNYFDHPSVNGRRVYVFSDTPHLIKTIRNRLYNNGVLQIDPSEPCINWEHFRILHAKDKEFAGPGRILMCPKLSVNHLELNNAAKMRVRLAVQIFSNSVANGLRFFKKYSDDLKDSESTASFCEWINSLFDALNRKVPEKGVFPGNSDFQVIEDSLNKLDRWEADVENGKIPKNLFLTKQTAEGLRVTLKSMIDLIQYLVVDCGFSNVLTGRLNQDALERFFGTLRQTGRCNDHPSTPTFLCIYKILSVYSVLKPPKFGNCTLDEKKAQESLITLDDLKKIYDSHDNNDASRIIRDKLDKIIHSDAWSSEDFTHIIDHNYNKPEVSDCVAYVLCAELTKRISQTIKCNKCKNALISSEKYAILHPRAKLTISLKNDQFLHPSSALHRLILFLEELFIKHRESQHVFECILDDLFRSNNLSFPCTLHASDVLLHIVQFFVRTRMQQYAARVNLDTQKTNQLKKKLSKYCVT